MKGSLSLGRVFGIPIRVHFTFALILLWAGWIGWKEADGSGAAWAVALTGLLFGCVVLHELGHSVVAQRFGVHVRSITLLPIGGVAAMSRIPERPVEEFLIAVAGPLVNVVIVAGIWLARVPLMPGADPAFFPVDIPTLMQRLAWANIVLVVFNLLPAFPMDGGRIFRSLLAMFLSYPRATAIAAAMGQFMSFGFLALGLMGNPFLVIIAIFIFLGARGENRMMAVRELLRDVHAADIMKTAFAVADASDRLVDCSALVAAQDRRDLPVVSEGQLVGLLDHDTMVKAGREAAPDAIAVDVMRRRFISFAPDTQLVHFWQDIWTLPQRIFPVQAQGNLVGLITPVELQRFIAARGAVPPPLPTGARGRASGAWRIDLG